MIFHHHHHQSLNREGRWGTTDDFATSFLHFSLFSTALWDLPNSRHQFNSKFSQRQKCSGNDIYELKFQSMAVTSPPTPSQSPNNSIHFEAACLIINIPQLDEKNFVVNSCADNISLKILSDWRQTFLAQLVSVWTQSSAVRSLGTNAFHSHAHYILFSHSTLVEKSLRSMSKSTSASLYTCCWHIAGTECRGFLAASLNHSTEQLQPIKTLQIIFHGKSPKSGCHVWPTR